MGQINGLTWFSQDGSNVNLLASVPLGFNTDDPDALEFTINPIGVFGTNGTLSAEGLVIDNLLNAANVTVTQGIMVVTVPALTKDFVRLNPGQPVTVSSNVTGFTRCFFFRGQYFASAQQSNDYEIQGAAMEERFTNGSFNAYLNTLRVRDANELPIGTNLNNVAIGGKYRVYDPINSPSVQNEYWYLEVDVVAAATNPESGPTGGIIRQTITLFSDYTLEPRPLMKQRWVRYFDNGWYNWQPAFQTYPRRYVESFKTAVTFNSTLDIVKDMEVIDLGNGISERVYINKQYELYPGSAPAVGLYRFRVHYLLQRETTPGNWSDVVASPYFLAYAYGGGTIPASIYSFGFEFVNSSDYPNGFLNLDPRFNYRVKVQGSRAAGADYTWWLRQIMSEITVK